MFNKLVLVLMLICLPCAASADIVNYVADSISSNPVNSNGVELRTGSVPPQDGVELFVFNPAGSGDPFNLPEPPYGTEYTIPFQVSELPAVVVAIPGRVSSYDFVENNSGNTEFPHTLTIKFTHSQYAGGVEADLPGPVGDFAIAFIPASNDPNNFIPSQMGGAYMATNISPNSWTLIPPDEESPEFGFEVYGPTGNIAFFDFFVPNSLISYMSALFEEGLSVQDLALFNNNDQVSVNVKDTGTGGLININVNFDSTSNVVEDQDDEEELVLAATRFGESSQVKKDLTVGRADNISLTTSSSQVKRNKKVRLFGWVKDGQAGEKVSITSAVAKKLRGKQVVKKVKLNDQGYFSTSLKVVATDKFRAIFKRKGSKAVKSKVQKVKAN